MSSSTFPTSVDNFPTQNDVSASDASDVSTYQNLIMTPNLTSSQQAQLTSLTQKLVNAGKLLDSGTINHMMDAITATQSYFLNTVNSDINNMENEFAAKVTKFSDQGAYNSATNYMDMNFVTWNGQSYICKQDNTVGIDPSHTSNWALVAQKGDKGDQGVPGAALSYVGTYNSASTYQQNQLVTYNGSTYICLQNNTTNILPTNTTYWTLFVTGATPIAQSSAPTNPTINQLWIDTTSPTNPLLKYWNGSQWDLVPAPATTNELGVVLVSATPQTGYPVAVSTVDPAYEQITGSKYIVPGTGISSTSGTNQQTLSLDIASSNQLGGVKASSTVNVDANGVATVPVAASSQPGVVKPGEGLIVDVDGTLKASWSVKGLSSVLSPSRQSFTRSTQAGQVNGTQVASNVLRLEQGRFHKAPFIEESSANALSANQSSIETDTAGFSTATSTLIVAGATISRDTSAYYQGSSSLKVVTTATSGEGVETLGISASASSSYTASVWVKAPSGQAMQLLMRDYTNSISATPASFTGTGQWQRVSITLTTGATAVTNLTMAVVIASATAVTFNIDCLQIENKAYSTTWITGGVTRNADVLSYTLDKPLASRWSASIVWKPQQASNVNAPNNARMILAIEGTGTNKDRYQLQWIGGVNPYIQFRKSVDGTNWTTIGSNSFTFNAGDLVYVECEDDPIAGYINIRTNVNNGTISIVTPIPSTSQVTDAQEVFTGCYSSAGYEVNGTIECIFHELASGETVTTDEVTALFGASDWGLGDYPPNEFEQVQLPPNGDGNANVPSRATYFNYKDSNGNFKQAGIYSNSNGDALWFNPTFLNGINLTQVLSGGYKIQSGTVSTPNTAGNYVTQNVTFPNAFTSTPLVFLTQIVPTQASNMSVTNSATYFDYGVLNPSTTGFTIVSNQGSPGSIEYVWLAIGS